MILQFFHARLHDRTWLLVIAALLVFWFFNDREEARPPYIDELNFDNYNIVYHTDFQTADEAITGISLIMLERLYSFPGNAFLWLLPGLSALLLARLLGGRTVQTPLQRGRSRTHVCLSMTATFYLTVLLMWAIVTLRMILQLDRSVYSQIRWGILLRQLLFNTLCVCGLFSATVFFAFATQNMFHTTLLSFAWLGIVMLLRKTAILPTSFVGTIDGLSPSMSRMAAGAAISLFWIALFAALSCLVYNRRDIRYDLAIECVSER